MAAWWRMRLGRLLHVLEQQGFFYLLTVSEHWLDVVAKSLGCVGLVWWRLVHLNLVRFDFRYHSNLCTRGCIPDWFCELITTLGLLLLFLAFGRETFWGSAVIFLSLHWFVSAMQIQGFAVDAFPACWIIWCVIASDIRFLSLLLTMLFVRFCCFCTGVLMC